ncbi:MAG: rhodanese-like domain-containing protein [Cyanobium sp.]
MADASRASQPLPIEARDLAERLNRDAAIQLVDVREDAELALARLSLPVVHLPLSRAAEWAPQIAALLERDRPVAVLCHAGVRSWRFGCWLLQEQGFSEVWNLEGGIEAWSLRVDASVPRY